MMTGTEILGELRMTAAASTGNPKGTRQRKSRRGRAATALSEGSVSLLGYKPILSYPFI